MMLLNDFDFFQFSKRINRPLILDGAMGSLLEEKGLTSQDLSWSAKINLSNPEEIIKIHNEYIVAGADIITTNTFRTNPYALKQVGIDNFKMYVSHAVRLAKESINNQPILIAGSNPPAEDCYQQIRKATKKELELNHCNHIDSLIDNGCHFVLNETQSHFDEIKIICEFCFKNKIPFIISLYLDINLKILSGESVSEIIRFISNYNPLCISFNCISNSLLNKLFIHQKPDFNFGFYLNLISEKKDNYASLISDKLKYNPSFIGACCGSRPEDISSLKELLNGRNFG